MTPSKQAHYRSLLEARAEALVQSVRREMREARQGEPNDVGDEGDESFRLSEDELRSHMNAADVARLREIEEAQVRLTRGTYGICETCGQEIDPARLELIPEARRCAADQEAFEQQTAERHPTL
jgi:DnaK suppressor protein